MTAAAEDLLLWLAEVPFGGPPHRQQHLARLLRSRYRVLYVEPPPPQRAPRLTLRTSDGIVVAQVAPLANARPLRGLMSRRFGLGLARLTSRLQLRRIIHAVRLDPARKLTIVCSNVFLFDAARSLRARRLITDMCDDPRYYPGEPSWTAEFLRRSVQEAGLVTTSSRALEQEFLHLGARRVALVPNGIHEAFLQQAADLARQAPSKSLGPVVIGFVGHLGPWVDFQLLTRLATHAPECTIHLVGSVAPSCAAELEVLRGCRNVRYTPAVPYAKLPPIVAQFSVGLIPFRLTPYTRAVNPIKLYEYAAFNLPVVCTPFSPDVLEFQPAIDVCATPEAFVSIAQERAAGRARRATRHIAEAHTWEHISRSLVDLIQSADP